MPLVFFGHGSPMNAIYDNEYTQAWVKIGAETPRPKGIIMVSAHWFTRGTWVTGQAEPATIYDFGGFTDLENIVYPAPGDPTLAERLKSLLAPAEVSVDEEEWGFDHGTWSVLVHAYPQADVPVVQISIDGTKPASFHYELAKKLAPLRDEGYFIVGSGNVVHNLRIWIRNQGGPAAYDWAERFEAKVKESLETGNDAALVDYLKLDPEARLAVPTPEHYLPLIYLIALRRPGETVKFPVGGVDGGSISMLTVQIG